jgi:BlaI family transcriptional regulator, penicillinase repressor
MRRPGPPRGIPPRLEMLCLKALWTLGEGNVRDVRDAVAESRALAYTTVMTLLERLARKNVVSRRKVGRAFLYTPAMSRDAMRRLALEEFVDCYFDGSEQRLAEFLRRHETFSPAPEIEPEGGVIDTALL